MVMPLVMEEEEVEQSHRRRFALSIWMEHAKKDKDAISIIRRILKSIRQEDQVAQEQQGLVMEWVDHKVINLTQQVQALFKMYLLLKNLVPRCRT
jgi:hypothetical protein